MKIETKYDIASSVNIGAEYDKGVKKLFKSKEIIVPIMEMVIPEFEGCSQKEILNCLDLDRLHRMRLSVTHRFRRRMNIGYGAKMQGYLIILIRYLWEI